MGIEGDLVMDRLKLPRATSLSLLVGLALIALPVEAGTDSWSVAGQLSGGYIAKLVVDPSTPANVYAAGKQGVYKSTDAGVDWTLALQTLNEPADLAIDPLNPATLYVVFGDAGALFKTTDGGATWSQMDNGISGVAGITSVDEMCSVAVDPVQEGVVYAGGCNTGLYRSTDGGAHWASSSSGLETGTYTQVNTIAVDPATPAVLYAIVTNTTSPGPVTATSIFRSSDSGAHWNDLGVPHIYGVGRFAFDPTDHTHVLACSGPDLESSTDSGVTWHAIAMGNWATSCAIDPSDPNHILVGTEQLLQVSTDGATFAADPNVPQNGVSAVAFDAARPAKIYLGSGTWGVLASVDGGASWAQSTSGIHGINGQKIVEGSDGIMYMSTSAGIYKSLDQGATWTVVGANRGFAGSLPADAVGAGQAFVQDPVTPATLYAGGDAGLLASTDGGDDWSRSASGMPSGSTINSLAIDPQAPATLYAGISWWPGGGLHGGVFKSTDGAASWSEADTGLTRLTAYPWINAVTVDPRHSNVLFAAPYENGLYKSMDGGATWSESDSGMVPLADVFSIAFDPTDSNVVYVCAVQGFFKSTDGGASWMESDSGLPTGQLLDAIQIDPVDPTVIYLSPLYDFGSAYVSSDAGVTWSPLTAGLSTSVSNAGRVVRSVHLPSLQVMGTSAGDKVQLGTLMLDPRDHKRLYAGGNDGVVYSYEDQHPPTTTSSSGSNSGGGTGGGNGGGAAGNTTGGGGNFPILGGILLCLALARRKWTAPS